MLNWGIVGCGSVAEHKGGPALMRAAGSRVVAVMSRSEASAAGFAERHGIERWTTSLEELLSDEDVVAVYIATPPHVHAEQAVACAEAGKHVLCEKPMALDLAGCDRVIAACAANGVQLMVAYYRRLFPAVVKMKELLDAGRIGRPTKIRAEVASLYAPRHGDVPWRADPAVAGGGFMWDIGSHRLDLMIHLLGDVADVAAFVDTVAFDLDVEDSSVVMMRFASGAQGVGAFHWNVARGGDVIEIGGTEGRIVCDMATGRVTPLFGSGEEQWSLPPPAVTHLGIVENFIAAIRDGRPNCLPGEESRKTNAVLEAAVRSSRERRFVALA